MTMMSWTYIYEIKIGYGGIYVNQEHWKPDNRRQIEAFKNGLAYKTEADARRILKEIIKIIRPPEQLELPNVHIERRRKK